MVGMPPAPILNSIVIPRIRVGGPRGPSAFLLIGQCGVRQRPIVYQDCFPQGQPVIPFVRIFRAGYGYGCASGEIGSTPQPLRSIP